MQEDRLQQLFTFLELSPSDSFTLYSIAYEYMMREDFEHALEYFNKLKDLHPDYVGTYYHLGKTLERLEQAEEAIQIYRTGMEQARAKRDMHALSELQRALNSALGMDYEDEV